MSRRLNSDATLFKILPASSVSNPAACFRPIDANDFSNEAMSLMSESAATSFAC